MKYYVEASLITIYDEADVALNIDSLDNVGEHLEFSVGGDYRAKISRDQVELLLRGLNNWYNTGDFTKEANHDQRSLHPC